MKLRLRLPAGQSTVDLAEDETVEALKKRAAGLAGLDPAGIQLLIGFPPVSG